MCLVFIAVRENPHYPLIVAFNRDEVYERSTAPAGYWEDSPHILGGRDLQRAGTWAGLTSDGRLGLLTFIREPHVSTESPRSRGLLVADFLRSATEPAAYLQQIHEDRLSYHGFNLVVGNRDALYHYSRATGVITHLEPGLHGLSNADLNTPWFKVRRGKEGLRGILKAESLDVAAIFTLMADRTTAADDDLPRGTGRPIEWEREVSSMLVRTSDYGTRSTTVIAFGSRDDVDLWERSYVGDSVTHFAETHHHMTLPVGVGADPQQEPTN